MLEKSNLIKDISKTTNLNVEDIIDLKISYLKTVIND